MAAEVEAYISNATYRKIQTRNMLTSWRELYDNMYAAFQGWVEVFLQRFKII